MNKFTYAKKVWEDKINTLYENQRMEKRWKDNTTVRTNVQRNVEKVELY